MLETGQFIFYTKHTQESLVLKDQVPCLVLQLLSLWHPVTSKSFLNIWNKAFTVRKESNHPKV